MIYLASPYSSDCQELVRVRFDEVCRAAGWLMCNGVVVYSPIAHCHPIAGQMDLPTSWEFWQAFDIEMITRSDAVFVLMLDGWRTSTGVQAEIKIAHSQNKQCVYVERDICDI